MATTHYMMKWLRSVIAATIAVLLPGVALGQKSPIPGPVLSAPKIQAPLTITPQLQAPPLQPATTRYVAEAANADFQGAANTGGIAWQCAAGKCSASGPTGKPTVQQCSELARTAGALRSFTYGQYALDPNELAQCNAIVAAAPKPTMGLGSPSPGIGSMPQLGTLTPLPATIAPIAPPASAGAKNDVAKDEPRVASPPPSGATLPGFGNSSAGTPPMSMPDLTRGPPRPPETKPPEILHAAPATTTLTATIRPTPVNITTGALSMTGVRFEPVTMTTSGLSMTGNPYTPVAITTSGLSITGNPLNPVTITTSGLSMTGNPFNPVTMTTPGLSLTGNR